MLTLRLGCPMLARLDIGVACWLLYCGCAACWHCIVIVILRRCYSLVLRVGQYMLALLMLDVACVPVILWRYEMLVLRWGGCIIGVLNVGDACWLLLVCVGK